MKRLLLTAILALSLLFACSKPSGPDSREDPSPREEPKPRDDDDSGAVAEKIPVGAIKIKPLTLAVGDTARIAVEFLPADATDRRIKWSVDTPGVVSIDDSGLLAALRKGSAKITAESVDGGKISHATVTTEVRDLQLRPDMISSNNPLLYETWGRAHDYWSEDGSATRISGEDKAARKARYGNPENLWDGDLSTCYSTNFDIYVTDSSWRIRSGAQQKYNYIQLSLDSPVRAVNISFTMSDFAYFDSHCGFRIEGSDTDQNYMDPQEADDKSFGRLDCKGIPGETIRVSSFTGNKGSLKSFRIIPEHGYTWMEDHYGSFGYFAISELSVQIVKVQ